MLDAIDLATSGVPGVLHLERFAPKVLDDVEDEPFEVEFSASGITRTVPVGTSILLAAEVLEVIGRPGKGEPLVYHDRAFYRLVDEGRVG